ncbi:MAG: tetratricopeptide repeat protein, partial [Acidobacteria bacterium]
MRRFVSVVGVALAVLALLSHLGSAPVERQEHAAARGAPPAVRADSVRDEIAARLRLVTMAASDSTRARLLAAARGLATAYAVSWSDSFLVRRVAAFEAASPARRRDMAAADSLWRAGRTAIGRDGVPAALALWRRSLRHATVAGDSAARAVALGAIGAGFYSAGELDSAGGYLAEAERMARATGDHRTLGTAIGNLASVSKDRGELARASRRYREALEIRSRSGDTRGMAADHNNLGLIAWSLGDLAEARRAFERALALNRVPGRERHAALNRTNLGDLASVEGDYATARADYEEALALNRATGDSAETAFVLHRLGRLATRRGDYPAAIAALTEALAVHERSGARLEAVAVRSDLAGVRA